MRFLSPEWLTAAAGALRAVAPRETGAHLVVQQIVTNGPDGEVAYLVRISTDAVELVPGRGDADVVFTEDWDTAAAIGEGRLSPQAALMEGRIRTSGNVSVVMAAQDTLASVESALAGVRAATTYGR